MIKATHKLPARIRYEQSYPTLSCRLSRDTYTLLKQRQIKLFILPPCSPELNGYVERAHRTHTEEFYEVTDSSFDLAELRGELMHWEETYNKIRPHQALGYLTPMEFITQCQKQRKEVMCH